VHKLTEELSSSREGSTHLLVAHASCAKPSRNVSRHPIRVDQESSPSGGAKSSVAKRGRSAEAGGVTSAPQCPPPSPDPSLDETARLLLRPVLHLASLARHGRKACLLLFDALALYLEDAILNHL